MSYLGAEGYCVAPLNVLLDCNYGAIECPTLTEARIVSLASSDSLLIEAGIQFWVSGALECHTCYGGALKCTT